MTHVTVHASARTQGAQASAYLEDSLFCTATFGSTTSKQPHLTLAVAWPGVTRWERDRLEYPDIPTFPAPGIFRHVPHDCHSCRIKRLARNLAKNVANRPLHVQCPKIQIPIMGISAKAFTALLCWVLLIPSLQAATHEPGLPSEEFRLHLVHLHTGERLDITYRVGDHYIPAAIQRLNYFLRDHRTGDVRKYDPRVFDLLADITRALGQPGAEIEIVCGYRTPWSNQYLRRHHQGVAQHSLHTQAKAIDIRVAGIGTRRVRETALALARGGVGFYSESDFVHVDVGRVRHWEFPVLRGTHVVTSTHTLN